MTDFYGTFSGFCVVSSLLRFVSDKSLEVCRFGPVGVWKDASDIRNLADEV